MRVFRNLTRRCFSIQHRHGRGWQTVAHASSVELRDVLFVVSKAGRQQTLCRRKKHVHAWADGEIIHWCGDEFPGRELPAILATCRQDDDVAAITADGMGVSYNPYIAGTFFNRASGSPVRTARQVIMTSQTKLMAYGVDVAGHASPRTSVIRLDCKTASYEKKGMSNDSAKDQNPAPVTEEVKAKTQGEILEHVLAKNHAAFEELASR